MKKPRHLVRNILLAAAAIILVAAAVRQIVWATSSVRFYSKFLYTSVADENRKVARELYEAHADELVRVSVAEQSRSRAVIRFVFESERPIEEETRDDVLSRLRAMMDSTLTDGRRSGPSAVILHWEVLFCSGEGTDEVWTAALSREGGDRSEGTFSQWQEHPEYARQLSAGDVRKLLKYTWCSEGISQGEIEEIRRQPQLWTITKLYFKKLFGTE